MSLLLGIDTGGTYTDAVLYDDGKGVVASSKALTTKFDLAVGIRNAVDEVLVKDHPAISLVSLSTTLATNALVEGQGSSVCLILIGYPSDALKLAGLGKAMGEDPVVFISGGHKINGDEQAELDLESVRSAILEHASRVSAFAISGYFGVNNPTHELAVAGLVRQLSHLPVTCGHELTSNLHAPRRALTTALNARLIPFLQQLIVSVQAILLEKGIEAPLMVVKGDGSLVEAQVALEKPVETILSGPAASVVGARHLSGEGNVLVVDMGGTTTDIALLENSRPALSLDGALVGGWHTMVEAIAVHTSGLGGDSEVHLNDMNGLVVGPMRAVPLSLLASQYSTVLEILSAQVKQGRVDGRTSLNSGRFALRQRTLDGINVDFSPDEEEIWKKLDGGPLSLESLFADRARSLWSQRSLQHLIERGLVVLSAFTPTDAAHILGYQNTWVTEAAQLGAELWSRKLYPQQQFAPQLALEFCQLVFYQVALQLGRAVLEAVIPPETSKELEEHTPLQRLFIDSALDGREAGLVDVALTLKCPLVGVGAPAVTYFPTVAERLHTRLHIPPHAEVANAVGAVVGSVVQTVRVNIRQLPDWKGFRIHLPDGIRDDVDLEQAAEFATKTATKLAHAQALRAGASTPQIQTKRLDHIFHLDGGAWEDVYLGTEIIVTAVGRPNIK